MSTPDLGQFGSQYGKLGSQQPSEVAPVVPMQPASQMSSTSTSAPTSVSSIRKSERDALIQMISAALPMLPPPEITATSINDLSTQQGIAGVTQADVAVAATFEKTKNEIIDSMWNAYMKGVREFAEASKEKYLKDRAVVQEGGGGAMSSTEYLSYLMGLSSSQRDVEEMGGPDSTLATQFQNAYNNWIVDPANSSSGIQISNMAFSGQAHYPDPLFIVGALVCSPALIREAIGSDHNPYGIQISVSPVSDAISALGPVSGLPTDIQAASALVAALLNTGAVYRATNDAIAQGINNGQPPRDLDFALNYAQNILAIVTHKVQGDHPTDTVRSTQNRLIRLMLVSMALNMVFRAGYGGMSGVDFASLLNGDTKNIPEKIRPSIEQLVGLINSYLPQDPTTRAAVVARLSAYVDSKSSIDSMLAATRAFTGVLKSRDVNQGIIDAATG